MAAGNNIFLELTGPNGPVAGSCADSEFKGKIELKSFSFSVAPVPRSRSTSSPVPVQKPSPAPTGRTTDEKKDDKETKPAGRQDDSITVVKVIDASSADLLLNYCKHLLPDSTGQEFKQAVITFRLVRNTPVRLLVLTFTGLNLIDYQLEQVTEETIQPTEKMSFSYKTCSIQYSAISTSTTGAGPPRSVSWDRAARQTR